MEGRMIRAMMLAVLAVGCGGDPAAFEGPDNFWDGGRPMHSGGDGDGVAVDAPRFGLSRPDGGELDGGPAASPGPGDDASLTPRGDASLSAPSDAGEPDAAREPSCQDSDGDGVCNFEDACPLDPLDDRDGDTVCDGADPCPDDAQDDSDGDGVCDSDDLCPGHPDDDTDGDSKADWCERCQDGPVIDADQNGYMDACDQVLFSWRASFENLLQSSSVSVVFGASSGSHQDGTHYSDRSSVVVYLDVNGKFQGEVSEGDLSAFAAAQSRPGATTTVTLIGVDTLYEGPPLPGTFLRAVVRGEIDLPEKLDVTVELRGY